MAQKVEAASVICSNELQSSTFSLSSSLSLRVHSMLMKDYTRFAVYSPAHSTMHLHDDGLFIVLRSAVPSNRSPARSLLSKRSENQCP